MGLKIYLRPFLNCDKDRKKSGLFREIRAMKSGWGLVESVRNFLAGRAVVVRGNKF
jgi:hypothetical protein